MARTPLMQSLVRLAAEHELADRLKVPVEECGGIPGLHGRWRDQRGSRGERDPC
jgi:hypothetical protein